MRENKVTFKEWVVKQHKASILWLPALHKMAETCYGDYAVHKPLQTWLLQVCVQDLLLPPERKISSEGQWFHSHILQNLRWHNWHITLLLNSLWAVLQSGAMAGNFPVNYTYEAALMLFAGWFHYHWCLASKVDECFLWCRVSEIYMGRHNLQ